MAFSQPIGEFFVAIGMETSQFRRELKKVQTLMRRSIGSEAIGLSEDLARGMAVLATATLGVATSMVVMAARFEQTQTAFSTLMKSTEKATALLYDLDKFAALTPFQFDNLAAASRTMLAFGFSSQEVLPILQQLGDVAAGSKQPIEDLAFLYGKAHISGRIMAKDLNQFLLRGIPLIQEFAAQFGVAENKVRDMVRAGKVKFENLELAMRNITEGQGLFTGSMKAQSLTVIGLWSTLSDNVLIFMKRTGKAITDGLDLREVMSTTLKQMQDFNEKINSMGVAYAINDAIGPEVKTAVILLAGAITGTLVPAFVMLTMWAAAAALPLAPYFLIGAAVVGLALVIKQSWKDLVYYTKDLLNELKVAILDFTVYAANMGLKVGKALVELGVAGGRFTTGLSTAAGAATALLKDVAEEAKIASNKVRDAMIQDMLAYKLPRQSLIAYIAAIANGSNEGVASTQTLSNALLRYGVVAKQYMSPAAVEQFTNAWISFKNLMTGSSVALKPITPIEEDDDGAGEKLIDAAKDITKSITDEWAQATMTKMQLTEKWYNEQKATLDESKAQISNYNEIVTKLDETAFNKRKEIIDADIEEIKKKFAVQAKATVDQAKLDQQFIQQQIKDEDDAAQRKFQNMQNEANGSNMRNELAKAETAQDLARFTQQLNDKNAAFLANLDGRKEMIRTYEMFQMEAHRSSLSYMSEGYRTLYGGLTDMLTGLATGTKNLGDAIKDLGMQLITMVVKWQAQKMLASTFSKGLQAAEFASSATLAASTAAVWAPAAAMVAAATFGASTGMAAAGLASLSALASSFAIPGLAAGGIVSKPTVAMVGEGGESEAIIPLSKLGSVVGAGAGGGVVLNVINQTGSPMNASSRQYTDGGKMVVELFLQGYERDVGGVQSLLGRR